MAVSIVSGTPKIKLKGATGGAVEVPTASTKVKTLEQIIGFGDGVNTLCC